MRFKLFLELWQERLPVLKSLANNFFMVAGIGHANLYFSYQTLIGYSFDGKKVARQNEWGPVTGRHIRLVGSPDPPLGARLFESEYAKDIGSKVGGTSLPVLAVMGRGKNQKSLTFSANSILYFSYETLISYYDGEHMIVRESDWGTVTGRHLNMIPWPGSEVDTGLGGQTAARKRIRGRKERRLDAETFAAVFNDLFTAKIGI